MTVAFTPSVEGIAPVEYRYDFDGDGVVDLSQPEGARVSHTFAQAGIFQSNIWAVDAAGLEYTALKTVVVENLIAVNAILSERWSSLSNALQEEDTEGALINIFPERREKYRGIFATLQTRLPGIMGSLPTPELLSVKGHVAQYRLIREQIWEGAPRTITYYLWFVRDKDGIWRLEAF